MSTTAYDARGGMRNVWIITAAMTVLAVCYTMIIPFLPIYLLELGVPKADVALWSGLVFGITFLIAGIMAPIWGKIADNKGKNRMALRAGFCHCHLLCINRFSYRPISTTHGACPRWFCQWVLSSGDDHGIPQC